MIDIDYFKKVNDSYSHDVGDQVLKHVALLLRSVLRESDLLGRLGGEEFAVLLPNVDRTRAYQLAERLRCLVEESPYTTVDCMIPLTISIGLKALDGSFQTLNHLLDQADKALYEAKKKGRNRVIIAMSDGLFLDSL